MLPFLPKHTLTRTHINTRTQTPTVGKWHPWKPVFFFSSCKLEFPFSEILSILRKSAKDQLSLFYFVLIFGVESWSGSARSAHCFHHAHTPAFMQLVLTFHFNHCFSQSGQSLKPAEAKGKEIPRQGEKQTNPQTGAGIHSTDTFSNVFSVVITQKLFLPCFDVLKTGKREDTWKW